MRSSDETGLLHLLYSMKLFLRTLCALLLTAATSHAVPVTVRVADANGQPVAGARVEYVDYANLKNDNKVLPAPTTARTAIDGTLALDLRGTPAPENPDEVQAQNEGAPELGVARAYVPGYGATNIVLRAGDNLLKLRPPAQVQGVVRDANGAPIAGAKVVLRNVETTESGIADWNAGYGLEPLSALTNAQGVWKMEGLAQGYANFIASAPAKVAQKVTLFVGEKPAAVPPIVLPPAGTIKGRILDADGQPVPGVQIGWDGGYGSYGATFYSGQNGNFALTDAPLDNNILSFFSDKPDWMGVTRRVEAALEKPGEIVDVGEVRAGKGVVISGEVRDKNSDAPLPNFRLRFGYKVLRTGANGRFEGRVKSSTNSVFLYDDYLSSSKFPEIAPNAERFDVGEITVERGIRLRFDLRDETGRAAPDARVRLQSTNIESVIHQRDSVDDGQSSTVWPLPIADYSIEGLGVWQVIEPKTVSVSASDANAVRTLTIRLRQLEPLRVSGRVVDTRGEPVAGADVQIGIEGVDYFNALSRKDGLWQLEVPVKNGVPILGKVQAQSFQLTSGGEITRDGAPENNWRAADIVMARTDIALAGRVLDQNGAPVSGARVGWDDKSQFQSVAVDNQGKFEIKGLPNVPTTIFASSSDGARFFAATATLGVAIELKLPPARAPLSDAEIEKLWEQLKIRRISDLGRFTEALGARRVFEAARRFDATTNPTQTGQGLDDYLSDRAPSARTPAERESVAREGVEWLRRFDVAAWSLGMGEIAALAAQTDDDELREWAARWYDAQKTRVRQPDSPDKLEWYHSALTERVMQVGAALGRDDATKYRDIWLSQIDKPHEQNLRQYLPEWGETLWMAEPKWFDEIVGAWPATQQMRAIVGALKVEENPTRAKALLARLEKLAADPVPVAADAATSDTMSPISKSVQALYQGRTNFARSMALVDAPAALDALDQVRAVIQSGDVYEIAGIIARKAITDGQPEIARRALKLGLSDTYTGGSGAPILALISRPFDADLAAQLMEVARKNATPYVAHIDPIGGWSDVATYAIALRDLDAGAGRLLLEKSWAELPQTFDVADAEHLQRQRIITQEKLAWAMAFYDLPRALQWLGEIKDTRDEWNNGLERTRLAILVAALTPPQRRSLLLSATYFQ